MPEDIEITYEVLPDNWPVFCLFEQVRTQWRSAGMGGVLGLDYTVVFRLLDRIAEGTDWDEMLDDLRVMETAAMSTINKRN
jgi:hypothetical protein